MDSRDVSWTLPHDATAPSLARRLIREHCVGCTPDTLEWALVLTNELVTNAVEHGSGEPVVRLRVDQHLLRIEVHDESPEEVRCLPPNASANRGRGLAIVDAVSSAWGAAPTDHGKTIWFELRP